MKGYSFSELLERIKEKCAAESKPGAAMYDVVAIIRCGLKLTKVVCVFPCTVMNITTPNCKALPSQASDKLLALIKLKRKPIITDEEKNETAREILEKYGIEVLRPLFSQISKEAKRK